MPTETKNYKEGLGAMLEIIYEQFTIIESYSIQEENGQETTSPSYIASKYHMYHALIILTKQFLAGIESRRESYGIKLESLRKEIEKLKEEEKEKEKEEK